MNAFRTTFIMIALFSLIGCASIVSKSEYPVNFSSEPMGAKVTIVNSAGQTIFSGNTPTTVVLKAGRGFWQGEDYAAKFEYPDFGITTAHVKRGVDGWYIAGNFVFGGLIGWLIVDPATGAMWTLDNQVHVSMNKLISSVKDPELKIVSVDQIPTRLKEHMIPIK